jgi:hypothetical protein
MDSQRLRRIVAQAGRAIVEVETHPVVPDEYRFLASGEIFRSLGDTALGSHSLVSQIRRGSRGVE